MKLVLTNFMVPHIIRRVSLFFCSLAAAALGWSAGPLSSELRTWTGHDGSTLQARLVAAYDRMVFLEWEGRIHGINVAVFSPPDVQYVVQWALDYEPYRTQRPTYQESEAEITRLVRASLRHLQDGRLVTLRRNDEMEPEFYVFYFSASWCAPCQRFTPRLVSWYKERREQGMDNFEVFLVSSDRSSSAMAKYMKDTGMPWLAVAHRSRAAERLERYGSSSIPQLAVVDRYGHLLFHSIVRDEYKGPNSVLSAFDPILKSSNR